MSLLYQMVRDLQFQAKKIRCAACTSLLICLAGSAAAWALPAKLLHTNCTAPRMGLSTAVLHSTLTSHSRAPHSPLTSDSTDL